MPARDNRAVHLLALANAGGVVAYAPFLTLLLPARVQELAGGSPVRWLAAATLVGAIAASVGNILFGWASDVVGTRRSWMSAGLLLTLASYGLLGVVSSLMGLVMAVGLYQLCLNMMLAPLAAWAADAVPDDRKGLLGGWLSAGPLIGALAGMIVTVPGLVGLLPRLATICLLIVVLTAPLLIGVRSRPHLSNGGRVAVRAWTRAELLLLGLARLFVQVAGSVLFAFLLYYFGSLPEPPSDERVARLAALALLIALPVSVLCGRLSDQWRRRRSFLVAAAGVAGMGLCAMAWAQTWSASVFGYVIFLCALSVFLSLHSGFAMLLLPSPTRRGRDLGFLNLTNTLPAIVAPVLAAWLVPEWGFQPLLLLLALLMGLAAGCILLVRDEVA